MSSKEAQTEGRLRARPVQVTGPAPVGLQPLMLGAAPELKRGGYDVLYRELDGEHSISLEITLEAIGWFTREKFP